jgi:glycosyltransferase involved in cell wall biosynthesis
MNILYISDQFLPAASADTEQFINMVSALSSQTHIELISAAYKHKKEVTLQQLQDYYAVEGEFKLDFVNHLFPNIRGVEKINFAIASAFKSRKKGADVIYTRNIPVFMAALIFTDLPVVYETFRPWPERNVQSRWFFKKIANHPRFLGIILHSYFAKEAFLKNGFSEEQLLVAHNAIKSNVFNGSEPSKETLRKKLALPEDKMLITYTGRVHPAKGLGYMLKLASAFREVHFLIVGSEGKGAIERTASTLANVQVIPWQDESGIIKYILASDVLYIPTSTTAREKAQNTVLPIKTFLYKASGKAILAPDIADLREVLTHKKTAWLVEPDNEKAAVEALSNLLADKKLRLDIGKAAQEEMRFMTWENRARNVLEFIENRFNTLR